MLGVKMKKRLTNNIFRTLLTLSILVILATILMIVVYSIPIDRILRNVKLSANIFNEDLIKTWNGNLRYAKLDTTTDAYMINSAICRFYDSPIKNAMLNPNYQISSDVNDSIRLGLLNYLNNGTFESVSNYSRYWHGYLLVLIPGLFIFTASELKVVLMIVLTLLTIYMLYELGKINKIYVLIYSIIILFLNPISIVLNYALFSVYLISIVSVIVVLKFNKYFIVKDRYYILLTIIGSLTSFFDFLTYPLLSFGLTIITIILINKKTVKESVCLIVLGGIQYSVGYLGMWSGKWLVLLLLTGNNIFSEVFNRYLSSSSGFKGNSFLYIETINRNLEVFDKATVFLVLLGLILIFIYILIEKKRIVKDNVLYIIPMSLLALIPFVWYFLLREHAYVHPWYEYRQLSMTILSIYSYISIVFGLW